MFAIGIRVQKTFWNFDSFIDSLIKKKHLSQFQVFLERAHPVFLTT